MLWWKKTCFNLYWPVCVYICITVYSLFHCKYRFFFFLLSVLLLLQFFYYYTLFYFDTYFNFYSSLLRFLLFYLNVLCVSWRGQRLHCANLYCIMTIKLNLEPKDLLCLCVWSVVPSCWKTKLFVAVEKGHTWSRSEKPATSLN